MPLAPNTTLSNKRYRISKPLGQGGFGSVYLAEDTRLGNRPVAIKEALGKTKEDRERAEQEARMMSKLSHANLVQVLDTFGENGNTYVVMQYVEGHDLMQEVELAVKMQRPLPVDRVLGWIEQVGAALAYLHQQDVVHRDVKPHNMRVRADGAVILIDLGIAKKGASAKTGRLQKGYTPPFAPPEQCTLTGSTNRASDVYALGITMYIMLTATVPPESLERLGDPPSVKPVLLVPPTQANPGLPKALGQIILKATELSSTQRYKDAGELLAAIRAFRGKPDPVAPPAPPAPPSPPKTPSQSPVPVVGPPGSGMYVARFCPRCGNRNRQQAKFCVKCGNQLTRPVGAGAGIGTASAVQSVFAQPGSALYRPLPSQTVPPQQHVNDADRFMRERRYDDAIAYYERAERSGYATPDMLANFVRCCVLAGRPHDAAKRLEPLARAASNPKQQAVALGLLARVLQVAGKNDAARQKALEALQLDGDAQDACYALGVTHIIEDRYGQAVIWLQRAVSLDPNDYGACHALGVAKLLNGETSQALVILEKAVSLEPRLVEAHLILAQCAAALGNTRRAQQAVQQALQLDPTHKEALALKAGLGN